MRTEKKETATNGTNTTRTWTQQRCSPWVETKYSLGFLFQIHVHHKNNVLCRSRSHTNGFCRFIRRLSVWILSKTMNRQRPSKVYHINFDSVNVQNAELQKYSIPYAHSHPKSQWKIVFYLLVVTIIVIHGKLYI